MTKSDEPQKTAQSELPCSATFLEALFQKDRDSQWGKWIHGLIHNINGPLQNVSLLFEMLQQGQTQMDLFVQAHIQDPSSQWTSLCSKQGRRFQQLSQQLQALSEMLQDFITLHEIQRNESEVDLKVVLSKLARVFRADPFFKHHVQLELQLAEDLPLIRILGRDLVPALTHLFQNALIAMRQADHKKLRLEGRCEGNWICVRFCDCGCGLDSETPGSKLLEPFYSNWPEALMKDRRDAKCFGFGLFAVSHLLSPYGVQIDLDCSGEGTAVTLRIPLSSP